jgi:hypothetical protein
LPESKYTILVLDFMRGIDDLTRTNWTDNITYNYFVNALRVVARK